MSVYAYEKPVEQTFDIYSMVISDLTARQYGTVQQQSTDMDPIHQNYQTALDVVVEIRAIIAKADARKIASERGEFQPVLVMYPVSYKEED